MKKILLSATIALATVLPVMANSTQITMTATVDSFLSVQLVNSSDNSIVSTDGSVTSPSYETLGFGNVDARGLSNGTLTGTKSIAGATLSRVLLDPANKVYTTAAPPASVLGALYYIPGSATTGYSVVTNKSAGGTTDVVVKKTAGDIRALVDTAANLPLGANSTVSGTSIQPITATGTDLSLATGLASNTKLPVTIGLFVENTTTTGSHTATLTFTGT